MAFAMYPGLTQGAIAALLAHASPELKKKYLPKMIDRRMDRHDEPDRAALRHRPRACCAPRRSSRPTAATRSPAPRSSSPPANTTWPKTSSISCWRASKARRPAPRASRCSSCRRFMVNDDGSLGARNGVSCGSIEEKMGIHGNATCVMNYDGATGWLIGEENRGLNAMFVMMNEARLGVGVQGLAQSRSRLPERRRSTPRSACRAARITGVKYPDKPADPIIVHPDVRRMLMTHARLQRGGARAGDVDGAARRRRPPLRGRKGAPERRRPHGPAHAGHQRRAHRHRLCQYRDGAAGVRRPRLYRRARHGAVRARRPHRA